MTSYLPLPDKSSDALRWTLETMRDMLAEDKAEVESNGEEFEASLADKLNEVTVLLLALDGDLSDEMLVQVDLIGLCPMCGEGLDTGAGFGNRDLECGDYCGGEADEALGIEACRCGGNDEDAHCAWSGSYPFELYMEKVNRVQVADGRLEAQVIKELMPPPLTCAHRKYAGGPHCAEMACFNYVMKHDHAVGKVEG